MRGRPLVAGRMQSADTTSLTSPTVGVAVGVARKGTLLAEGDVVGQVQVLGVLAPVVVPAGVHGYVTRTIAGRAERVPVEFGTELVEISAATAIAAAGGVGETESASDRDVFPCPSSGRFYGRPSPDKEPFVREGQTIARGDAVCLLEVMKTFNRIAFDGDGTPERARVVRVLAADGDDLGAGDPLIEFEPL